MKAYITSLVPALRGNHVRASAATDRCHNRRFRDSSCVARETVVVTSTGTCPHHRGHSLTCKNSPGGGLLDHSAEWNAPLVLIPPSRNVIRTSLPPGPWGGRRYLPGYYASSIWSPREPRLDYGLAQEPLRKPEEKEETRKSCSSDQPQFLHGIGTYA